MLHATPIGTLPTEGASRDEYQQAEQAKGQPLGAAGRGVIRLVCQARASEVALRELDRVAGSQSRELDRVLGVVVAALERVLRRVDRAVHLVRPRLERHRCRHPGAMPRGMVGAGVAALVEAP